MQKMEIIVPKFDNDGSDNSAVVEQTIRAMCGAFGGATVYDANGYWISPTGQLYKDANAVIVSASTATSESRAAVLEIARMVLDLTDQEAVFVSDGTKSEIIS